MKSITNRKIKNKIFQTAITATAFAIAIPLVLILYYIVKNGSQVISLEFFISTPKPMGMIGGGILNALIGSILIIVIASIIAIPLGVSVGIYLAEFKHSKFAKIVQLCAEVLQGVPSIVIGVISYLWLVKPMKGFTGLAGSIALAIMMLPIIIRSTEETIKMIPGTYKEAALALGVPYSKTIRKVIIPYAFNGILTSVLIAIARIAGETAPLIFTAFGSPFLSFNVFKPIDSLPLMIYKYASSPFPQDINFAWGVALILCTFILALNLISKGVAKKWKVNF